MTELILKECMENAQAESSLAKPNSNDDMNIELSKEFLMKLQSNAYHGMFDEDVVDHIAKGEGKITTWEDLVEKFFCKFYPKSRDGEDEMLEEGDNWGIDPLEFISRVDIVSSDEEWEEPDYGNPPNTTTDSFLKPYFQAQEKNDIEKEDERSQKKRKGNNSNLEINILNKAPKSDNKTDEPPNKRVCKAEKFKAIKYLLGPNKEYIAIKSCEYNTWGRNDDSVSQIYQ
ncbi:hypothetical protein Tco_0787645 [Tanacetum coccineum]